MVRGGRIPRLLVAAAQINPSAYVLALRAGDAGLRKSEITALKWTDLDLERGIIHVQRSIWEGKGGQKLETIPKGGRGRKVTMTKALADALTKHRHLRGPRVLYNDDGNEFTDKAPQLLYSRIQRKAGLEVSAGIHRLRHSFCSRLAVHDVAPTRLDAAIGLLDRASGLATEFGETVEKAGA